MESRAGGTHLRVRLAHPSVPTMGRHHLHEAYVEPCSDHTLCSASEEICGARSNRGPTKPCHHSATSREASTNNSSSPADLSGMANAKKDASRSPEIFPSRALQSASTPDGQTAFFKPESRTKLLVTSRSRQHVAERTRRRHQSGTLRRCKSRSVGYEVSLGIGDAGTAAFCLIWTANCGQRV